MPKIYKNVKNVKKCQNGTKTANKCQNFKFFSSFFWLETTSKMVLSVFTQCLVPEIHIFGHLWLKSAFLGLNFSRTKEITANPMVLSYIEHFYKH